MVAAGAWWLHRPLDLKSEVVDLSIEPGTRPREVAQQVREAGADVSPGLLFLWFRLSGQSRLIKAGSYELETGITPRALLSKLARGDQAQGAVSLIEGWTFRQFRAALAKVERLTGKGFGRASNPLLVSVRSGAKFSMPGMMDTVLNLGLNDASVQGLARSTNDERFAYDSYRRFIAMFGRIVLGVDGQMLIVAYAGAVANGSGLLVVPLVLPLRAAIDDAEAVTWQAPTTTFQLMTDPAELDYGRGAWQREIELSFGEVF